jgi:GABA permease
MELMGGNRSHSAPVWRPGVCGSLIAMEERQSGGGLGRGLKPRHMTMISLGGIIGAGLFVGSGAVIAETGPATVISYVLAGALIVVMMRMLGEMAVANPTVGSFVEYCRSALGGWAGFSVGWLYWYFWAIVLAIEATAGAEIIQGWLPGVPQWLMCLILMAVLTATNLFSVKSYGEFEFWFASIKVAAIVAFILIGLGFLVGLGHGDSPGLHNLTADGGFAPHGVAQVLAGVVIVIFAFIGAEIVTIAAGESEEPEKAVARATRQVVARVSTFYIAAVFLVICIVPWTSVESGTSPFTAALDTIGIPGAADVMDVIIVTAVLSCLNSGIYVASRMLFSLARRGDAPKALLETNGKGVPVKAILLSVAIGFISVIFNAISPETVFLFLVNSSGAVALFCYILIALAELRMRRRLEREDPERLKVRMWLFPWLTYAAIAGMVAVIVSMAFVEDVRAQLIPSLISLAVVLAAAFLRQRRRRDRPAERAVERATVPGARTTSPASG